MFTLFYMGAKCKASIYCEKTVKDDKVAEPGIFKEDSTKQSTVKALKVVFYMVFILINKTPDINIPLLFVSDSKICALNKLESEFLY